MALISLLVIGLNIDVPRVGDMASIQGSLPSFWIPDVPFTLETLWIILPGQMCYIPKITHKLNGHKADKFGGLKLKKWKPHRVFTCATRIV